VGSKKFSKLGQRADMDDERVVGRSVLSIVYASHSRAACSICS
jgi:hypothetical protein